MAVAVVQRLGEGEGEERKEEIIVIVLNASPAPRPLPPWVTFVLLRGIALQIVCLCTSSLHKKFVKIHSLTRNGLHFAPYGHYLTIGFWRRWGEKKDNL